MKNANPRKVKRIACELIYFLCSIIPSLQWYSIPTDKDKTIPKARYTIIAYFMGSFLKFCIGFGPTQVSG